MVDDGGAGRDPDNTGVPQRVEVRRGYVGKAEAAAYLGIGKRDLSKLVQRRKIPYRPISRKIWLFKLAELDRAMDRLKITAVGE